MSDNTLIDRNYSVQIMSDNTNRSYSIQIMSDTNRW
ncbi:hypothetical protein Paride_0260 [Pseudomonas phage Paride]|nr:hypothetical protein Paride_0260 [Pseudomonas phage Paride]